MTQNFQKVSHSSLREITSCKLNSSIQIVRTYCTRWCGSVFSRVNLISKPMARRKLKTVEKVILIGFVTLAVMMTGLWVLDKQPNRAYYLPDGFEGWVKIRYSVENAPALVEKDGVLQFVIGEDGTLETSDKLVVGWRRDEYFYQDEQGETVQIPSSVEKEGEYFVHIHQRGYYAKDWTKLLLDLPFGTDTILADETRLVKLIPEEVEYVTGQKTLEYFYVSRDPQSILFNPPNNPEMEGLESTEDRQISRP